MMTSDLTHSPSFQFESDLTQAEQPSGGWNKPPKSYSDSFCRKATFCQSPVVQHILARTPTQSLKITTMIHGHIIPRE
jgi:hypothetical protein